VKLFFRSFQDSFYFLIIFFYATAAFGLLFTSSKDLSPEEMFGQLWLIPFDLNLGNFSANDHFGLDYLGFLLASIVNVIVMLSLLISILGDSFDRFMLEAVEIDHIEMAELIYDIELLLLWNKSDSRKEFMQICDSLQASYTVIGWEGTSKAIEQNVAKSFDKRLRPMQNSIDDQYESLNSKIRTLERLMTDHIAQNEAKTSAINSKLNQILASLGQ
jgi:hypothetical protein